MKRHNRVENEIIPGIIAGLMGGLVFALTLPQTDLPLRLAQLVRIDIPIVAYGLHLIIAMVLGAGFGVMMENVATGVGEMLFWGLVYGIFWWFLGLLTLLPLLLGQPLRWDVSNVQDQFPAFIDHILYGATLGLVLGLVRGRYGKSVGRGTLLRGGIAGLAGGILLGAALDSQEALLPMAVMISAESRLAAWLVTLVIGLLAGIGFAVLYPRAIDRAGTGLLRGMVYGFLWWIIGGLTALPVVSGRGPIWTTDTIRGEFAMFPAYLLFGAIIALIYHWLDRLTQLLFADDVGNPNEEGAGTQGLRAVGYGFGAGLIGGLLFTLVMVQIGFLRQVAQLVGASSELTGLMIHLVIAVVIGMSYGLLFRRAAHDLTSALGWGVSYGIFWWILGALTLMPLLLGLPPQWSAQAAAGAYASLVGHILYGAGLGLVFNWLERRSKPWWITETAAEVTRVAQRQATLQTSAPAIWSLVVIIILTLPIILGM